MLKLNINRTIVVLLSVFSISSAHASDKYETDAMYRAIIKSVDINDFALMTEQYHKDAVVLSKKKTELFTTAVKRWEKDGDKLYAGGGKAELRMRFKERKVNSNTAFESGIYHYKTVDGNNKVFEYYSHFEDLNVKINGKWKVIMERNVKVASEEEFNQLAKW